MAIGGLKKRRRIQLVIAGFFLILAAAVTIGFVFSSGIEFFRSPSQVVAENIKPEEVFRLGGLVEEGSIQQTGETTRFVVTDGNATLPVTFTGILPDLFAEGQGMIATGSLVAGEFQANEILAKHDEEYLPKEVADALKEQGVFQPNGTATN